MKTGQLADLTWETKLTPESGDGAFPSMQETMASQRDGQHLSTGLSSLAAHQPAP